MAEKDLIMEETLEVFCLCEKAELVEVTLTNVRNATLYEYKGKCPNCSLLLTLTFIKE